MEEDGDGLFVLGNGGRGVMEVWEVIRKGKGDGGGGMGRVNVGDWWKVGLKGGGMEKINGIDIGG